MAITSATYTPEITWTPNLAITSARLNNFIGTGPAGVGGNTKWLTDNISYSPYVGNTLGSAIVSKTSGTTYVAVDTVNYRINMSSNLPRYIGFWLIQCTLTNTAHTAVGNFTAFLDGVQQDLNIAGATIAIQQSYYSTTVINLTITLPMYFTGVVPGAHNVDLYWKTDGSAGVNLTVYSSRAMMWEAR